MREARDKERTRTYVVAEGEAKNDITNACGHVAATTSGQLYASRQLNRVWHELCLIEAERGEGIGPAYRLH